MRLLALILPLLSASALLAGCTSAQVESFSTELESQKMTGVFDPAKFAYVQKLGTATIKGKLTYSPPSGNREVGKFAHIRLIPVNAYSKEHIGLLFGNAKSYFRSIEIDGIDKRYQQYMRHSNADVDGNFTFFGVPAGQYYAYAAMLQEPFFAVYGIVSVTRSKVVQINLNAK